MNIEESHKNYESILFQGNSVSSINIHLDLPFFYYYRQFS